MLYCKLTISTYSIGTRMAVCKIEASAAYDHVLKLVCSSSASRVCRESLDQRETLDHMEQKEQWLNIKIYIYILNMLAKVSSHFWGPVIRHYYYFREILDETENQEDLENMARRDLR